MLKLLCEGRIEEYSLPGRRKKDLGHAYPVYHRMLPGGMLVVNSFTDEAWLVRSDETRAMGKDVILSQLAKGPNPEVLIREAGEEARRIRASRHYEIGFCPTYSCNLKCVYCYQQSDPSLDKRLISPENLRRFLQYAEVSAASARASDPERPVALQLFGGEPFSAATKPVIQQVFEFCRSHKIHVAATSNGVGIGEFFDILLPYHGYVAKIGITIDGLRDFHDRRRKSANSQGSFDTIVRNINILLRAGIPVMTSLTLDRSNLGQVLPFLQFARAQGWADNPLIELSIARVDDRKYEMDYSGMFGEAELLIELLRLNAIESFPRNIRFGFLKASLPLARKLKCDFNQKEEGRGRFRYCWACSALGDMVYVDAALDVYRCTYTVGNKGFRAGTLNEGFNLDAWREHSTWGREECTNCPIGGYCSGGCRISARRDFKRSCDEERRNFEQLIDHVVMPRVSGLLAGRIAMERQPARLSSGTSKSNRQHELRQIPPAHARSFEPLFCSTHDGCRPQGAATIA